MCVYLLCLRAAKYLDVCRELRQRRVGGEGEPVGPDGLAEIRIDVPPVTDNVYRPMSLPSLRVLHFVKETSVSCNRLCCGGLCCHVDKQYSVWWTPSACFNTILVSPLMITDHLPDTMGKALASAIPV